jgi:hypothetical protein
MMNTSKLDMRALKVGQKVTLSDALPGGGTTGVVADVTKWHVSVQVAARIEGALCGGSIVSPEVSPICSACSNSFRRSESISSRSRRTWTPARRLARWSSRF